jgi:radical SAM superfamily enzyme YgiQ (UPF0313 family)
VVRALHQRNIGVYGMFIFGYDADTKESIERTLEFALESRLELANFNPLTPTPGSALYDRLLSEGRLLSPKWWLDPEYRYGDAIFEPRGMRAQELTDGVFEARRRFYSWGSIGSRVMQSGTAFSPFRASVTTIANMISRREIYKKQHRQLGR